MSTLQATRKSLVLSEQAFNTSLDTVVAQINQTGDDLQRVLLSAIALAKSIDDTGKGRDFGQVQKLVNKLQSLKRFKGKKDLLNFIYMSLGAYSVPLDEKGNPQKDSDGHYIREVDMDKVCRSINKNADRTYSSAVMCAKNEIGIVEFRAVPWSKRDTDYNGVDIEWAFRTSWYDMPKAKKPKQEKLSAENKLVADMASIMYGTKTKLTTAQSLAMGRAIKELENVPAWKSLIESIKEELN